MLRSFTLAAICASSLLLSAPAAAQDLAPPPPMNPSTTEQQQQQQTTQRLDEAEREDSKRHFELVWLDAQLGGSYIDMRQISQSDFQIENANAGGPMFSVGGGVRLVVFVLGARARYNALSSFNMWQLNGELGLKVPISSFDFLIGGHGGYSFVGSLGQASVATSTNTPTDKDAVKIRGFNAGLDVALDYYVSPTFSIGVGGLADFLFLNRPPLDLPAEFNQLPPAEQERVKNEPAYARSGTSIGMQLALGLRLGLHFGL